MKSMMNHGNDGLDAIALHTQHTFLTNQYKQI
jgi:hypothetical protein